jgi:hypothetical protein
MLLTSNLLDVILPQIVDELLGSLVTNLCRVGGNIASIILEKVLARRNQDEWGLLYIKISHVFRNVDINDGKAMATSPINVLLSNISLVYS